jgi:hypothetical protein
MEQGVSTKVKVKLKIKEEREERKGGKYFA